MLFGKLISKDVHPNFHGMPMWWWPDCRISWRYFSWPEISVFSLEGAVSTWPRPQVRHLPHMDWSELLETFPGELHSAWGSYLRDSVRLSAPACRATRPRECQGWNGRNARRPSRTAEEPLWRPPGRQARRGWEISAVPRRSSSFFQREPPLSMALMFGKARTCNIVTVPEHEPAECNVVVLGALGSGKSGTTYITVHIKLTQLWHYDDNCYY